MAESLTVPESVTLTATGMDLPPGMEFGEWLDTMGRLFTLERATWWFIGDGLTYGNAQYGEKYAQAEALSEASGIPTDSLRAAQWVAERIEPARRVANLSWSHHRIVSSLEPAEQDRLLDEAERRGWSTRDLAEVKKRFKHNQLNPGKEEDEEEQDALPSDPQADADPPPELGIEAGDAYPDVDPVAEWQRVQKENEKLHAQLDALSAESDTATEIRNLHTRIAGLESRLDQETAAKNAAISTTKYYQRLVGDLRQLLGVEENGDLKQAVLKLVQRSTNPAAPKPPKPAPKPRPSPDPEPAQPAAQPGSATEDAADAVEIFRDGARREVRAGKTLVVVGMNGVHSGDFLRVVRVDKKQAGVASWGDADRAEIGSVALDDLGWDQARAALVTSEVAWAEAPAP